MHCSIIVNTLWCPLIKLLKFNTFEYSCGIVDMVLQTIYYWIMNLFTWFLTLCHVFVLND